MPALGLDDLRVRTKQALGNTTITSEVDNTWYEERVNTAYRRIATWDAKMRPETAINSPARRVTLRFPELEKETDRTLTAPMATNVVTPSDSNVFAVTDVYDLTNDRPMRRISRRRMQRLNPDEEGTPRLWVPSGSSTVSASYKVYPKLSSTDSNVSVREFVYLYPADLTGTNEPVFEDEWHPAIWMAAASEAALLLDWTEKYEQMEQILQRYIYERRTRPEAYSFSGGRGYYNVG